MAHLNAVKKYLLAIVGLWVLLYGSFTLVKPPLLDDADSVHAEAAREMLTRHDIVTLYVDGIRYLEKAPLLYWSMAASFKLFGVSDWAARLPLALYTLALVLVVFDLGRHMFASPTAGFYAALILLTSFGVFIFTRILIPDVILCLWIALAMLYFWRSLEEHDPRRSDAAGFGAALALGVLTKGLIGLIFPLVIVFLVLLVTRNLKHLLRWHPWLAVLVFLAIAAPWHIAAGLANPTQGHPAGLLPTQGNVRGFFWFYFVNEHLLRYLNMRVPRDYGTVPLLLFWALVLVWIAPWFFFLFRPLTRVPFLRALRREPLNRPDRRRVLLTLWPLAVLVFFSFSTRQEYYILPALPALALAAAGWLAADETEAQGHTGLHIAQVLLVLGWIGAAAAAFFAFTGRPPAPGADLSALLHQNPQDYFFSFGHFLDLNAEAMGAFRVPLLITAAALAVGVTANLLLRLRGRRRLANYFLAGMMAAFLIAAHLALVTFSPVLSSQVLAEAIKPELQPDDLVVINEEYESGSTLGFYLQRPIHILNGRSSNLWYGSFFPDAPAVFEDDSTIAGKWNGPQRLLVWTEPGKLPELPGPAYVIAKSGGKEIVSNQPNTGGADF